MPLIKIASVGTAGNKPDGRKYANDITGKVYFPRTKAMEFAVGNYAYVVHTQQTKTLNAAGELVDLPVPVEINQMTSIFASKGEAIEAASEVGTLELEVVAHTTKVAQDLGLTSEQVRSLAAAW